MRISVTFFSADNKVYSVCSLLTATDDDAGIVASVRGQWNDPQIASADVIVTPGVLYNHYAAKP